LIGRQRPVDRRGDYHRRLRTYGRLEVSVIRDWHSRRGLHRRGIADPLHWRTVFENVSLRALVQLLQFDPQLAIADRVPDCAQPLAERLGIGALLHHLRQRDPLAQFQVGLIETKRLRPEE
jgi:hypothetical protein